MRRLRPRDDDTPVLDTEAVDAADEPSDGTAVDSLRVFLDQLGAFRLLTAPEEVELAKRIERGDADARRRLIESNLRLVVAVAKGYRGLGVPFLDLIQEGSLGLMRAVEKFDHRRGYKFSTYAIWWIRQSVRRAVSNGGRTIRLPIHVVERQHALSRATLELETTLGRPATYAELASATGLSLRHVAEALEAPRAATSLNHLVGDEEAIELAELIPDPAAPDPFGDVDGKLSRDELRRAIAALPERERVVLDLHYGLTGEPETLAAIGRRLGLTRERVRQLESHALAELAHRSGARERPGRGARRLSSRGRRPARRAPSVKAAP
jgi:RNA polymerase primary sigma factor